MPSVCRGCKINEIKCGVGDVQCGVIQCRLRGRAGLIMIVQDVLDSNLDLCGPCDKHKERINSKAAGVGEIHQRTDYCRRKRQGKC